MSGLPQVRQEFFPLGGGLDLLTPAISLKSGCCIDAQNYEPEISGGYKRYAGHERYDGRPKPSSAGYWMLDGNPVGTLVVGTTVTGLTSNATARVLALANGSLVLGRLTGNFVANELVTSGFTRSSPGTYYDSTGVLRAAGATVPRLSYNPASLGNAPVVLNEAAASNLFLYSEQLENIANNGYNAATVAVNAATAPDGNFTADKFCEDNSNGNHQIYKSGNVVSGTPYTLSFYIKAVERTAMWLYFSATNGAFATDYGVRFDLSAGTVSNNACDAATITAVGGGWWRISATKTAAASVLGYFSMFLDGGGSMSYAGTAGRGVYVWGAQLEAGGVASSYIQTTTASATRAADVFANGYGYQITTAASVQSGSPDPSSDADYTLLAANDVRLDIGAVPGSGAIRGVWVYNDILYAFRDNAGGTAGLMYKATAAGWVQVAFGVEMAFNSTMGGTTPIAVGATIGNLGASPTKSATVVAVLTRSGTWGSNAVGTLIITPLTGVFANADSIFVGATQQAVATSAATTITRQPGGTLDFSTYNFNSSGAGTKFYGADGVNPAFEFDGINYIPIHTGMAIDTPTHVMGHRNFLFLSFQGSVQISAIANPYAWTVVLGAGEFACGDAVTGFLPQAANAGGSSMAIFTRTRTFILYGSSSLNWSLVPSIFDLGYLAFTMQPVSNNTYGMTPRGLQCLVTTLTYGDFDFNSVAHAVMPYLTARRGMETVSTTLRGKDQYRLYYSDNTCICLGLTGDSVNGSMVLNYGKPVRCITTSTLSNGVEVSYFGSDDGYVYQDNIGTSLDGLPIEAWVRLPFNHSKSPQIRKRYRHAALEVKALGYCKVNLSYDIGYAAPSTLAPVSLPDQVLTGGGGYWDQFVFEQFTWDSALIEEPRIALSGTEKNIGFLFYSNRAQDKQHTVQGLTVFYTAQRAER